MGLLVDKTNMIANEKSLYLIYGTFGKLNPFVNIETF